MTDHDLIDLYNSYLKQNPELLKLMEQFNIDEREYINSLRAIVSAQTYTTPSISNSTIKKS